MLGDHLVGCVEDMGDRSMRKNLKCVHRWKDSKAKTGRGQTALQTVGQTPLGPQSCGLFR